MFSHETLFLFLHARTEMAESFVAWSFDLCGVLYVRLRVSLPHASTSTISVRAYFTALLLSLFRSEKIGDLR